MSMFLIIDLTRQLPVQSNISKQRFGIVNANIYYYTKLILKFDLSSIVISDEFSINKCNVEKIVHLIYSKRSVLVQKLRFMHVKSQRGQDFALLPIFEYEQLYLCIKVRNILHDYRDYCPRYFLASLLLCIYKLQGEHCT